MKTYVISDVHGNKDRFRSVLGKIDLLPEDRLIIPGDMIDRHPHGIELLQQVAGMDNVTMLLGNHEYMMLNAVTPDTEKLPWKRPPSDLAYYKWFCNGGKCTLDAYRQLSATEQRALRDYLAALPLNLDLSVNGIGYKLVHAAPVELYQGRYGRRRSEYPDSTAFAVWHRFDDFRYIPEDYIMIFGHTPTLFYQSDKPLSIWHGDGVIGIDCGSGFPAEPTADSPYQGRLACLRLDDMAEFYSDM